MVQKDNKLFFLSTSQLKKDFLSWSSFPKCNGGLRFDRNAIGLSIMKKNSKVYYHLASYEEYVMEHLYPDSQ